MIPIVAIVGRPNVGKSTLFNRLAGTQTAIVHDEPGVTRDRHYADVHIFSRTFTLIDTGGFDPGDTDAIGRGIARHVKAAVNEADVVLCVLDGLGPPTEADAAAVRMLRQTEKPVIYLANRLDNQKQALEQTELYALGIQPIAVSALHGRGIDDLGAALLSALPPAPAPAVDGEASSAPDEVVPRLALIGRPNAGKSSLLNRLSGEERSLVDERPGTTRDPVDARIDYKGQPYIVVDTAGIRRRSKVEPGIESASVMQSLRAISRADVVALLCDASEGLAEQDARLLGLVADRARPIVVGMNKMDLLDAQQRKRALEQAKSQLHFAPWAPIVPFSNKSGEGVNQVMLAVRRSFNEYSQRVPTGELNTFLQALVDQKPPPSGRRNPRLFFMTQAQTSPPVFVVMCSNPEEIKDAYRRFLASQVRSAFGFENVPVVIRFKNRRRRE
jgi:GTP-binding protein